MYVYVRIYNAYIFENYQLPTFGLYQFKIKFNFINSNIKFKVEVVQPTLFNYLFICTR